MHRATIDSNMPDVLNVLMLHQGPAFVDQLLRYWAPVAGAENLLVVHGGTESDFGELRHAAKIFVADPRLRTRDHPRERQSITAVLHAVRDWMGGRDFPFLSFCEYDHLPLVRDLNARQIERLEKEQADVLAFALKRVDGTSDPHYLYHAADPRFHPFFASVSCRAEPLTTLSVLGTGSFWRRRAFDTVAARDEPFPMYQEIYIPTLAHHLGFRVRDFGEQNAFVSPAGERGGEMESARAAGAWTLHPVKRLPALQPS